MLHDRSARSRGDLSASTAWVRALALVLAFVLAGVGPSVQARTSTSFGAEAIAPIRAAELPREGRAVLEAIRAGGPFEYRRDGAPFGNRERLLPKRERGYYAEYTVPTPGARDRGARRIVAGQGATRDVRNSGEYYYTDDHYRSFRRIVQ